MSERVYWRCASHVRVARVMNLMMHEANTKYTILSLSLPCMHDDPYTIHDTTFVSSTIAS